MSKENTQFRWWFETQVDAADWFFDEGFQVVDAEETKLIPNGRTEDGYHRMKVRPGWFKVMRDTDEVFVVTEAKDGWRVQPLRRKG